MNDLFAKYPLLKPILLAILGIVTTFLTGKEIVKPVQEELKQNNVELKQQNKTLKAQLQMQQAEAAYWSIPVTSARNDP